MKLSMQRWLRTGGFCLLAVFSLMYLTAASADEALDPFAKLEQQARNGDVAAQAELGTAYALGKGVEQGAAGRRVPV